ncbi:putative inactive dual specificity phosphatase 27-like [Triplophysa rosa]|uniref:Inactive dual specificity phosphatase 27-like n=2 Tax=Triplophysa rosa TaxID=992332 RepID=A0A9W8C1M3_TRIRA|nr:putative inactive dual specificity phosphatase 27-like [Triplophysa rosa]
MSHKQLCEYETPSVTELQNFLLDDRRPTGHVNHVWPNVYIGNEVAARDKPMLYNMGITHIVNAASGPPHVNTGPRFYRDMSIDYYGVEADDSSEFVMSVFFYSTARFIRAALSKNGKVLVHCLMGVSRSATLVLAFLMICEDLTLMEAIKAVRQHRDICPNPGFLNQLRHLDMSLVRERKRKLEAYKLNAPNDKPLASQFQAKYTTASLSDLRSLLLTNRKPFGSVSYVWPGLYIGDESSARDKGLLADLGITHIVNSADGAHRINTGAGFYTDMSITYCGVEASDHPQFDLSQYFSPTASFIKSALAQNGKVLVHCAMGVSRSGALVLAFLMMCKDLTLSDAIIAVRLNRDICPNSGFLEQLRTLDELLKQRDKQNTEKCHQLIMTVELSGACLCKTVNCLFLGYSGLLLC